jgi:BlaI family transcriptional regulator, penicillinase repressor
MATAAPIPPRHGPRRAILDLAPLELHCMNALWSLGEGSVRQIQAVMAPVTPRAYTTVMTIMDRLARKGIVTRRKHGRAYVYAPSLSADEARAHTVAQVIEGFFDGSAEALVAHVTGASAPVARRGPQLVERPVMKEEPAAGKAAEIHEMAVPNEEREEETAAPPPISTTKMDTTLL